MEVESQGSKAPLTPDCSSEGVGFPSAFGDRLIAKYGLPESVLLYLF